MEEYNEKHLIVDQYRIYSDSKEKFIDRQFATNRFYLILNIVILAMAYLIASIIPNSEKAVAILSVIGVTIATLWWTSIDAYQILIKVKYAKVLEYLETKLPEQPYKKEYEEYTQMKKNNNLIIFGDCQKVLSLGMAMVYLFTLLYNLTNLIRYQCLDFLMK